MFESKIGKSGRPFLLPFAGALLTASLLASAGTQDQERPVPPPPAPAKPPQAQPAPDPKAPQAEKPKEPDPNQVRMQKFMKLQFDRTPSAILEQIAADAAPPEPEEPEKPEKPEEPAKPGEAPKKKDKIDLELEAFQRDVTLGHWKAVKKYLAGLPEKDGPKAYAHLLNSLLSSQAAMMRMRAAMASGRVVGATGRVTEKNEFVPDDVVGLADASPEPLKVETIGPLGGILKQVFARGAFPELLIKRLEAGTDRLGGKDPAKRRAVALLLDAAGKAEEAMPFLPTISEAEKNSDPQALILQIRYNLARHDENKEKGPLVRAWTATQALFALKKVDVKHKEEALQRALDLVPKVEETLGRAWLEDSFTRVPARGIEILATIGKIVSMSRGERGAQTRQKKLELQHVAMEALLRAAPERAEEWRTTVNLLATNWLHEAEYSRRMDYSRQMGPVATYDQFGNIYYQRYYQQQQQMQQMQQRGRQIQAIETGQLLEIQPGPKWVAVVDPSLRPLFTVLIARLYLKVNEEKKAFPHIEQLAASHPETALELANEFLDVWANNHNPNQNRQRTNRYMYIYGYNPRSATIPLTRSNQARNLRDLAAWVKRLRGLKIGDLDERKLSKAFTSAHSVAEVYKLKDLEMVFGKVDTLKAGTVGELVQTMRRNLASVWRDPKVQEKNKTKRKDKQIEAEVLEGYLVAGEILDRALKTYPDHWAVHLAKAAILFDENTFRYERTQSVQFSDRRKESYAVFRKAAEFYRKALPKLAEKDESSTVYEMWFYASLGACDIQALKHEFPSDPRQPKRIRQEILALGEAAADRHLSKFANSLTTRMSGVKPELKHRYLKAGLEIAGDHKRAHEARKLFDFYADLVTEIKLSVRIDGSDAIGWKKPFGLFVDLRHTKEIEREAGGFQKYLTNQSQNMYYFNYGRPPADYRDRFEEAARIALQEHFEVRSVTYHSEKIDSRGDAEPGWRVTPYAYLLLQAKGPEVDEIPSLKIDLDFLDTSGYVVLPVASPRLPVDATGEAGDPRPVESLKIVQTLDERRAEEGKLILEIKATARGLIPELDEIVDVSPEGFRKTKTEDQGLSVARIDSKTDEMAAVTERLWMVHFEAEDTEEKRVESFSFAAPKREDVETSYLRYEDADLVEVEQVVALERAYGSRKFPWVGAIVVLCLIGIVGYFVTAARRSRGSQKVGGKVYSVPDPLTPFSVIGLLKRIKEDNGLDASATAELDQALSRLEQHYFNRGNGEPLDLAATARTWARRASTGSSN